MFGVNADLIMECLTTITTLTRNERVTRKFSLQSSQGICNKKQIFVDNIDLL